MDNRCPWSSGSKILQDYHDREWGVPVHDDRLHFEFLSLEVMQAGLSWEIVLKKRDALRDGFAGFEPRRVVNFGEEDVEKLLGNPGIIRNRRKIMAIINNALRFVEIQNELGSFDNFIWGFLDGGRIVNSRVEEEDIPTTSPLSDTMAREFKKRGFQFLGSITLHAHIQSIGMVNDHLTRCFRYSEV